MTWGLNKSSSSSSSSSTTAAAGRSSSSSVDGEFRDAAEYTTDLQEGHSTGKAATTETTTARRTQQSLRLAPRVDEANDDEDESMLLDDSGTPSTSLEPFELGAVDDEEKGLTTYDGAHHHHNGSTIVLPDTYSSVIMDCDNINDGGSTCGGSPDYDTTEQDRERQRRRHQQQGGGSSNDGGLGNGDEEDDDGGVLWNLKQNLVNKGLSWSDRLLDTTEAALDVTEKAVGFILSDDNTTTAASKSEGSDGQASNQQPNNPPEGERETKKKEKPLPVEEEKEGHHSLSEPALSVGEYSSFSDDDESIRSRFLSASSSVSSISRTALPSFAIPLRPPVTHLVPSLSGPPPTLLPGQKMNEHSEERAEEGVLEEALRSMKRIRLDNTESNTTGSDDKQQQDDDVAAFEARQQLLQDEADAMSTISTASSMKRGRASVPISGYNDDIMLPSSSPLERRHAASSSSNNHSCRRQRWIRVRDRVQQVSSTIYGASWSQVRQGSLRATGCVAGMAAQKVRSMVVGGVPPPSTAASSLPSSEGHAADDDGIVTTTTAALPVEAASEDGNNNAGACPCCCSSDPPTSVVGTSEDIDDGSNP